MPKIKKVKAIEIIDSRGNPTVECDIYLSDEIFGRAAVPSGASTGEHEAVARVGLDLLDLALDPQERRA